MSEATLKRDKKETAPCRRSNVQRAGKSQKKRRKKESKLHEEREERTLLYPHESSFLQLFLALSVRIFRVAAKKRWMEGGWRFINYFSPARRSPEKCGSSVASRPRKTTSDTLFSALLREYKERTGLTLWSFFSPPPFHASMQYYTSLRDNRLFSYVIVCSYIAVHNV